MIKLRHFVLPQNAAEELTLESVKAAFGIVDPPQAGDPPAAAVPPAGDTSPAPDTPLIDPPATPDTLPAEPPAPETPPVVVPPVDKVGQAFAQMRVQNKSYEKTLNGVAKILGIADASNPDTVLSSLNDLLLKAEAKKNNVPEDMYKRLQTLENQNQEFNQKQVRETAYFGFQKVKDTFKLDDAGLNKFADDLIAAGRNPFEMQVDLLQEYKMLHFDEILAAERAEGARLEAERAAKAAAHSSTPNNKQGQGVTTPEKINTVSELTDWFNKQSAK